MKYLWKSSKRLGDRYGVDEIRLFVGSTTISSACLCLLAYAVIVCIMGNKVAEIIGAGGICTALVGIVIGLFGSVLWMIRNEEEM